MDTQQRQTSKPEPGLYIVATPIGNRQDITLRALETLAIADLVICEDSRVTGRLLSMHNLSAKLIAYHDHNAVSLRPKLIERLKNGEIVAMVSDAGTPLISDPGYKLVSEARTAGIHVTAIPGPSALLAALVSSGLPSDAFLFAGFLPNKEIARRHKIAEFQDLKATLIFYESAQRLAKSLTSLAAVLGERQAVVARELTKMFEELRGASLLDLAAHYQTAGPPKGEIVIVVAPAEEARAMTSEKLEALLAKLLQTHSVKDAVRLATEASAWKRRDVYDRALVLKDGDNE